jgi:hypothetical protein
LAGSVGFVDQFTLAIVELLSLALFNHYNWRATNYFGGCFGCLFDLAEQYENKQRII